MSVINVNCAFCGKRQEVVVCCIGESRTELARGMLVEHGWEWREASELKNKNWDPKMEITNTCADGHPIRLTWFCPKCKKQV